MQQLSNEFLLEMYKSCLRSTKMLGTLSPIIEYHFLPSDSYKKVWKTITSHYGLSGGLPSKGVLYETNKYDQDAVDLIKKIYETERPKDDDLLVQVEQFIIESKFVDLHDSLKKLWEGGDKEQALLVLKEESESISTFSLKQDYHHRVFGDFDKRRAQRKLDRLSGKMDAVFIPTGIDELDALITGFKKKHTSLIQGQSGYGKSTYLRFLAVFAASMGFKVLFISAEDSEDDVLEALDQTWMNVERSLLRDDIPEEIMKKYHQALGNIMNQGGEIFVRSFEAFGSANMSYAFSTAKDVSKIDNIDVDLIVIDHVDVIEPIKGYKVGDTQTKMINVAYEQKNLALETNTHVASAVQGSTVDPSLLNDPTYVQTRYNIAGLKGIVRPYSYFGTINRTLDEKKKGQARFHWDKFREYPEGQTMTIMQNLKRGQFYNARKTREMLHNDGMDSSVQKQRVNNRNQSKKES